MGQLASALTINTVDTGTVLPIMEMIQQIVNTSIFYYPEFFKYMYVKKLIEICKNRRP